MGDDLAALFRTLFSFQAGVNFLLRNRHYPSREFLQLVICGFGVVNPDVGNVAGFWFRHRPILPLHFNRSAGNMDKPIEIALDAKPLASWAKILKLSLDVVDLPLGVLDILNELVLLKNDLLPAIAGETIVRLYPSDGMMRILATLWTRKRNVRVVEKA